MKVLHTIGRRIICCMMVFSFIISGYAFENTTSLSQRSMLEEIGLSDAIIDVMPTEDILQLLSIYQECPEKLHVYSSKVIFNPLEKIAEYMSMSNNEKLKSGLTEDDILQVNQQILELQEMSDEDLISLGVPENEVNMLNEKREHELKLPGVKLPDDMVITGNMRSAIQGKDFLVLAVPSPFTRSTARKMSPMVAEGQIIVDVAKGIEESTLMTLSRQIEQEIPQADVAVLSGPSHAEEVGRRLPTTCVIGAKTRKTAEYLQSMFISNVFRVYTSPDILGIELGGSLKNVIALAAGIADGLGYGDNTKAALITRGIAEIARLGVKMGGKIESFTGLTGIGDLIVTCASVHSRNRKAGYLIGQGMSMQEAMDEVKMVVEGVYSAKAAAKLAKEYDVSMPIVEEVNAVLFEGKSPAEAVNDLMMRESRSENRSLTWEE